MLFEEYFNQRQKLMKLEYRIWTFERQSPSKFQGD